MVPPGKKVQQLIIINIICSNQHRILWRIYLKTYVQVTFGKVTKIGLFFLQKLLVLRKMAGTARNKDTVIDTMEK